MQSSVAANSVRNTILVCCGLYATNEGAQDFSIHLRRDRLDVYSLPSEKYLGVFRAMDARGLDLTCSKPAAVNLFL